MLYNTYVNERAADYLVSEAYPSSTRFRVTSGTRAEIISLHHNPDTGSFFEESHPATKFGRKIQEDNTLSSFEYNQMLRDKGIPLQGKKHDTKLRFYVPHLNELVIYENPKSDAPYVQVRRYSPKRVPERLEEKEVAFEIYDVLLNLSQVGIVIADFSHWGNDTQRSIRLPGKHRTVRVRK